MTVKIGSRVVGDGHPAYLIGEIGLNHNGDVELAKRLIDVAADAGVQAVKFQKRTPEISTPEHMREVRRETPWGEMSYLEYRYRVEFDREQYVEIGDHATLRGLDWFASPWDEPSVDFLEDLNVVAHKVASASITDLGLLRAHRGDRQADHPVDRDVDDRADRPRRRDASAPTRLVLHARDVDLSDAAGGGQPADDPDPARRGTRASRSATRATSAACRSRSPPSRSARPRSSGTSPSTGRCGAPTTRRPSSRRVSRTWCATSGSSRRRSATASSACSRASSRRSPSCAVSTPRPVKRVA